METQTLIKTNINEHLPYGSLTKIKKAVKEKKNRVISVSHVRNVLNPGMNRWDDDVIEEAQLIVLKVQSGLLAAKEKMV